MSYLKGLSCFQSVEEKFQSPVYQLQAIHNNIGVSFTVQSDIPGTLHLYVSNDGSSFTKIGTGTIPLLQGMKTFYFNVTGLYFYYEYIPDAPAIVKIVPKIYNKFLAI